MYLIALFLIGVDPAFPLGSWSLPFPLKEAAPPTEGLVYVKGLYKVAAGSSDSTLPPLKW